MKKIFLALILTVSFTGLKAQYGSINDILNRLEEKRGINQNLKDVEINNRKFVIVKDFSDHAERQFLVIKGKEATFVEMFDDKANGQSSSNVFSGDIVRTGNNVLSFSFDKLEGKNLPLTVVKTLLMTKQKNILYLIDVNTKERWIDENAIEHK